MKKTFSKMLGIGACALLIATASALTGMADSAQTATGAAAVPGASGETGEGTQETPAEETTEAIPEPTEKVTITSCVLTDGHQIRITGKNTGEISGEDNHFYLFEMQPYSDSIEGRGNYEAAVDKGTDLAFQLDLNAGKLGDRLYSKFVVAVYDGVKFVEVSEPCYITNPESIARHTDAFEDPLTKKGLLIENAMLDDAFALGVKHVIVNIPFHHILGNGITYEYDGKTYSFNRALMEEYDETISRMTERGMLVTAVILNGWNDSTPQLVLPGLKKNSKSYYYAFNAATQEGYEDIKAIATFLADRYAGDNPKHGKVSNWIIGNEINNNEVWNYSGAMDIGQYVKEYERAFRVFYTAIKSTNKNARLYFSIDYNWNDKDASQLNYSGKDIVDTFNSYVRSGGQMDWGLAYHPYSIPLTEPEFWDDDQTGLIAGDASSPVINFKNLSVLTDYFQRNELLSPTGEVRHIILSEQGFTARSASRGTVDTDLQAAAFAYAYYIADSNPYIDAFIMSRQVDAVSEARDSLQFGLWVCDMNSPDVVKATARRKIWSVFRSIDTNSSLEATEFAKSIIGINKWSDVIPNFRYRSKE